MGKKLIATFFSFAVLLCMILGQGIQVKAANVSVYPLPSIYSESSAFELKVVGIRTTSQNIEADDIRVVQYR